MSKDIDYLNKLRSSYSDLHYTIVECINDLSSYEVKRFESNDCFYKHNVQLLSDFMKEIDRAEQSIKSKSRFSRLFSSDDSINNLQSMLNRLEPKFDQLMLCSKCACFKCVRDCYFDPCKECRMGSHILSCNKDEYNVRTFKDYIVPLINNDTGKESRYEALAIIEIEDDKRFIFLQNLVNQDDKLILEYIPKIRGIEYGEITDVDLFDRLVSIYKKEC